jgi:predicted outer membrane protein
MRSIKITPQPVANFRKKAKLSGIAMLSALCLAGMTSCTDKEDSPIVNTFNQQDKNFALSSSENINAQIKFGELAKANGQDGSIMDYGQRILDENNASKTELEGIVDGKDVTISKEVSDVMNAKYMELAALSGKDFDRAFINFQLAALDDFKTIYENEKNNGENFTLKGFADKTLGKIKELKAKALKVKAEIELGL